MSPPWSVDGDTVRLAVRVTPRAKRDEVVGVIDTGDARSAVAVRLNAPPVDGAANLALVAFLARALDVPKSAVAIVMGEASRLKIMRIAGGDAAALERLCGQ